MFEEKLRKHYYKSISLFLFTTGLAFLVAALFIIGADYTMKIHKALPYVYGLALLIFGVWVNKKVSSKLAAWPVPDLTKEEDKTRITTELITKIIFFGVLYAAIYTFINYALYWVVIGIFIIMSEVDKRKTHTAKYSVTVRVPEEKVEEDDVEVVEVGKDGKV